MKYVTTTALAALLVGSIGAMALAPAANAEDTAPAAPAVSATITPAPGTDVAATGDANGPGRAGPMGGMRGERGGPGLEGHFAGRGALLDFACGDRGAEALEIAFVHINYAVKPTAEQAPLLDALKTTAIADQKKVADTCQTALKDDGGKATMLDRLQTRLTLDNARVAALTDVLPKFKAFYDSLTDDQKAKLEPQHEAGARWGANGPGFGQKGFGNRMGNHRFGPGGMMQQQGAPGAAAPSDAPATPDAPDAPDSNNT